MTLTAITLPNSPMTTLIVPRQFVCRPDDDGYFIRLLNKTHHATGAPETECFSFCGLNGSNGERCLTVANLDHSCCMQRILDSWHSLDTGVNTLVHLLPQQRHRIYTATPRQIS